MSIEKKLENKGRGFEHSRYVRSAEERAKQDALDAAEDAAMQRFVDKYQQPKWWKASF